MKGFFIEHRSVNIPIRYSSCFISVSYTAVDFLEGTGPLFDLSNGLKF